MITIAERLQDDFQAFMKLFARMSGMIRVAAPGIIQSFDASKQTAVIQLAIKERVTLEGDANNVLVTSDQPLPILNDVPVVVVGGGGFFVTVPIAKGDECLVIFGNNCYDAWFQNGGVQPQMYKRRHDLSDGFAIVGLHSLPNGISGYSTTGMELRNSDGSTKVRVEAGKITISADEVDLSNAGALYKLMDERLVNWLNELTLPISGAVAGPVSTPLILANVATTKTKAG